MEESTNDPPTPKVERLAARSVPVHPDGYSRRRYGRGVIEPKDFLQLTRTAAGISWQLVMLVVSHQDSILSSPRLNARYLAMENA